MLWDGLDDRGAPVPAGRYFVRVLDQVRQGIAMTGSRASRGRMALLLFGIVLLAFGSCCIAGGVLDSGGDIAGTAISSLFIFLGAGFCFFGLVCLLIRAALRKP